MKQGWLHRRRIKTEEKAKVVTAVWGTEFIQFLAAPAILLQDDLNNSDDLCLVLCIKFFFNVGLFLEDDYKLSQVLQVLTYQYILPCCGSGSVQIRINLPDSFPTLSCDRKFAYESKRKP